MTSGYVLMEPCRTAKATADAKGSSAEEVLTTGNALRFDLDFPQIGSHLQMSPGAMSDGKSHGGRERVAMTQH